MLVIAAVGKFASAVDFSKDNNHQAGSRLLGHVRIFSHFMCHSLIGSAMVN